jgi:hypothetical protein
MPEQPNQGLSYLLIYMGLKPVATGFCRYKIYSLKFEREN